MKRYLDLNIKKQNHSSSFTRNHSAHEIHYHTIVNLSIKFIEDTPNFFLEFQPFLGFVLVNFWLNMFLLWEKNHTASNYKIDMSRFRSLSFLWVLVINFSLQYTFVCDLNTNKHYEQRKSLSTQNFNEIDNKKCKKKMFIKRNKNDGLNKLAFFLWITLYLFNCSLTVI